MQAWLKLKDLPAHRFHGRCSILASELPCSLAVRHWGPCMQAHGVSMGLPELLVIACTATLAAVGAAAIPSAGLVTMLMVLQVNPPCNNTAHICCNHQVASLQHVQERANIRVVCPDV